MFTVRISGLPRLAGFSSITENRGYLQSEIDRFELCICTGAIPFPYPSTYFRLEPSPGFLANRSTGSSALSWLARQAEHHSNPRWNPRETPSRPLIAFSSSDVVRLQIWAALRADAADPGNLYMEGKAPQRLQLPASGRFTEIAISKWLNFVDVLGRIERDHVWIRGKPITLKRSQSCLAYATN